MLAPKTSRACQVAVIAAVLLAAALLGSAVAYYSYVKTTRYATLTGEHIVITGEATVESTLMVYLNGSWFYLIKVRSNLDYKSTFAVQVYFNDIDLGTQTAEIPPERSTRIPLQHRSSAIARQLLSNHLCIRC